MATPNNATTGDVDDDSVGGGGMLSLEEDLRIGEQQHQAKQHHHHQAAAAVIQVPIINSNNGTTSNGRRRLLNNNMSSSSSVSTEFQKNFGKLHHIISTTDSTTSTTGSSSLLLEGSSLSGGGGGGERVSSSSSALFAMTTNTVTSKNRRESMKRMEETFTANKLRFSSLELVGREKELQILQECFERCCGSDGGTGTTTTTTTTGGGTRELVFLKGGSGTGKTSLAKHFVKRNNNKMAPVVVGFGKFHFLIRDDKPLSGFVDAFSSLFIQLQETVRLPIKAYTEFRSSLLDTFCDEKEEEEELRILLSMIPTIQQFFLNDDNHHHPSSNCSENNGGNDIVSSSATTTTNSVSSGSSRKDTSSSTPPSAMMHGSSSTTDGDGDDSIISAEATSQRMKNLFRKLCRVWTDHLAPLVIILDDLQWADQASLDLLETIFNDLENSKILVICSFRSEDVRNNGGVIVGNNNHSNDNDDGDHQQHPVNRLRTNLTKRTCRGSNITDIEIGNLSLQHTHSVINTLLSMEDEPEEEKTLELARICQRRTAGNVFFLLQFLVMLKEEELLEFNLGLYKWRWDLNKIESETAATANVVGMVTERLVSKLPSQLLSFLQLASCLGSSFHDRTLSLVWDHHVSSLPEDDDDNNQESEGEGARDPQHRADFQSVLDLAERNNFLEKDATNLRELSSHRWLHDNIQQAAMASITPSSHIDVLKCRVGISLLRHLTKEDLNREIFVVANLLTAYQPDNNNGNEALTVTPRVVELFLKAAEKASSVAAFQSAFRYSKNGIKLLPLDCWNTCFDHTLRLYSIATEASGFLGQIDEMLTYSAKVLDQPKCSIFDKLRVYFVKLELLQNNGEPFEAVDLGLQILRNLGCSFPKSTAGQVVQTIRALHKWKSKPPKEAQLRQLSPMADRKAKEIVKVIFRLEVSFYYTKQIFLYALASSRAVELVLDKGLCDYSGGAFFALGNILAALNGDLSYLRKWCDLSVLMTQLVPSGHHESRVIFSIGCGYMWSKPSANVPKNLLRGYKIGMRVGDTESAMWCCFHYVYFEFMASRSLAELEERCHVYISNMKEVNRNESALVAAPIWRLIQELIGNSDLLSNETTSATGSHHAAIEEVVGSITHTSPVAPYFSRVTENMLHAYRREYVIGAELAIKRGEEFLSNFPHQPIGIWDTYLRGLCLYAAAKLTGKRKYRRHAKKVRATIEKWVRQGNPNVRHHATLLAAEDLSLQKKFKEARQSYESSIVAASRGGFIHDAAIANERYALCLSVELNDAESAQYHFDSAEQLYNEWGATSIADGLEKFKTPASRREE